MSEAWYWVTIAGLTVATIVTRGSFLMLGDRVKLPARIERSLRYAPACALAAIVIPDLLFKRGTPHLAFDNLRLMAAIAASLFFLRTRNMLWTIVFGMAVFTALRLVV